MKKFIYPVIILITTLGFQSCEEFHKHFGNDNTYPNAPVVQISDNADGQAPKENKDSTTAKVVEKVAKNDSVIKALSDSISILSTSIKNQDAEVKKLKSEMTEIKDASVSVLALFIYLAIYTLVIILPVLLLVNKKTMSKKSIKEYIQKMLNSDDKFKQNRKRLDNIEQMYQKQSNDISSLNNSIQSIIRYLRNMRNNEPTSPQPPGGDPTDGGNEATNDPIPSVFYFEQPSNDKEFDDSRRKTQQTEDTLYKFTLSKNKKDEAEFVFEQSSPNKVNYALNVRDKKIDPVCDIKQNGNSGKFHCEPGKAKLKDGKWIVTEPAFITFN